MAKLNRREKQRADGGAREGQTVLDAVCFHIGRTFYQYVGLVEQQLAAQKLDGHLRPGMGHIILALYEEDDCIIKGLVERTQLSPSALTGLLQRMEEAGLIRRYRDKQDGRAVRVALTPAGRALEERCVAALKEVCAVMERGIGGDELLTARRVLVRMYQNIRDCNGRSAARA